MKKTPILVSELTRAAKENGVKPPPKTKRPSAAASEHGSARQGSAQAYQFVSENLNGPGRRPPRAKRRRLNLIKMAKGGMRRIRETARSFKEKGAVESTRDLVERTVACVFVRLSGTPHR